MSSVKNHTQFNLTITGGMIGKSTTSFMASQRFVHIMVRSSLLNILYRRLHLNESDLMTKHLESESFVVFKRKLKTVKDPLLFCYLNWLRGIQHAIDRNYLKEIYLYLKSPSDDILESYRFRLRYNPEASKEFESKPEPPEVKEHVLRLLQVLHNLEEIQKLDVGTKAVVEFTYNQDTPVEYEPPGFEPTLGSPTFLSVGQLRTHLGSINTGFHKLVCYGDNELLRKLRETKKNDITSENVHDDKGNNDNQPIDDIFVEGEEVVDGNREQKTEPNVPNTTILDSPSTTKARDKLNSSNITIPDCHDNDDILTIASEEEEDCICQLKLPDTVKLVYCSKCRRNYHTVCHGFFEYNDSDNKAFQCYNCGYSDEKLQNFSQVERDQIAKIRLLLWFIKKEGTFPNHILRVFPLHERRNIVQKVNEYQIMLPDNSVNYDVLNRMISVMFTNLELDSQFFE